MIIRAKLHAMASSEILQMIPGPKLREIKRADASPMFKTFVVGHEGEARGNLVGVGNIVKQWFRSAIEKLHDKIEAGLQLFHGHAETNETEGRAPVGEVVGKKLINIKNRLSSVVACYIYPLFRHLPFDVASIEADINLIKQGSHAGFVVADVNEITGIALGNSRIETPGFPGATLLGQLQAFAKNKNLGDYMEITIEEVKSFLKAENLKPSDLFGADKLAEDPAVKGLIETEKRQAVAGEYAHRKRGEEGFDKTKKELEDKLKERNGEVQKLRIETAKAQKDILFEKQKVERKLDEKQEKFIKNGLAKFEPVKIEDLEKEFNAYLDAQIADYKRIAKEVFGIEEKPAEDTTKKDGGTGPDDKMKPAPENKYLDPKQNPWIPKGEEV